jgi:YVTN family beta-propeller protein
MIFRLTLLLSALSLTLVGSSVKTNGHGGMLLVAEKGGMSLAIVNPASGSVVASVPEGGITGHEVAASPDGRFAYVPIYGDSGVGKPGTDGRELVVIDVASHKVVGNVDFGHGVRPHFPVFGPKDGLLYVTTELDDSVAIIDPASMKVVGSVPTGQPESHMLAISHDGRRGYTANVGPGTVSVLDLEARRTIAVIPVATHTQRISVSMDDKWVFTADQTKPELVVLDAAKAQVSRRVALPGIGYGSAPTRDGRWLLVALPDANQVAVIDLAAMQVVRAIPVPPSPQAVLMRPDGKAAYVSCQESSQVAEIDLTEWKVARLIHTGKGADGMAWAVNQ